MEQYVFASIIFCLFSDLRSKLCSERRARAPGFAGKVKCCIVMDTQVIWVE